MSGNETVSSGQEFQKTDQWFREQLLPICRLWISLSPSSSCESSYQRGSGSIGLSCLPPPGPAYPAGTADFESRNIAVGKFKFVTSRIRCQKIREPRIHKRKLIGGESYRNILTKIPLLWITESSKNLTPLEIQILNSSNILLKILKIKKPQIQDTLRRLLYESTRKTSLSWISLIRRFFFFTWPVSHPDGTKNISSDAFLQKKLSKHFDVFLKKEKKTPN